MLVGVAFALGSLLAAVLPTRRDFARAVDRGADDRSLPYLRVLTRASPADEDLARLYVRHLSAVGEFDAGLAALEGAGGPEPATRAARDPETENLRLDLLLARARAMPVGTPERAEAFAAVGAELEELRRLPQPAERLKALASLALELERPRFAAELLLDLEAVTAPPDRAAVLGDAGRWMRAAGDPARAAACYRQAQAEERDGKRAREYARAAVASLEAGNDVGAAADLASTYADQYPEVDWLELAARLAAAANRGAAARDLGRRIVALRPDDEARLEAQLRRELAVGDARGGLPLVRKLLALQPEAVRWHLLEARIAEWSGEPQQALADWLWLLDHGQDPAATLPLP